MFDLEKFASGEYYVHLPTLEVYNKAMKYLDDNGFKWLSGKSLTDNTNCRWDKHRQQTGIGYLRNSIEQGLQFSDLDCHKEMGYIQLEINEVEKGEIK